MTDESKKRAGSPHGGDAQQKLSTHEAQNVAKLASLTISDAEAERVTEKLNTILQYVGRLNAVDVTGIEPMSHVHGVTNVFREDVIAPSMEVKELLSITPDSSGRFIKVPIVIAEE